MDTKNLSRHLRALRKPFINSSTSIRKSTEEILKILGYSEEEATRVAKSYSKSKADYVKNMD